MKPFYQFMLGSFIFGSFLTGCSQQQREKDVNNESAQTTQITDANNVDEYVSLLETYKQSNCDDIVADPVSRGQRGKDYNTFTYGVLAHMDKILQEKHKTVDELKVNELVQITQQAFNESKEENGQAVKKHGVQPQLIIDRFGDYDIVLKGGESDVTQSDQYKSMLEKGSLNYNLNIYVRYFKTNRNYLLNPIAESVNVNGNRIAGKDLPIRELISPTYTQAIYPSPVNTIVLNKYLPQ